MKNKINELQVTNPPQPSLVKGGSIGVVPSLFKTLPNKRLSIVCERGLGWVNGIKAFTLAEVLITLGIIGVVAAITLPTLIQNYQKQVYVNQLKKTYSTVSQAIQKAMADAETDDIRNTPLFDSYGQVKLDIAKKYFNIIKTASSYDDPDIRTAYKALNGTFSSDVLGDFDITKPFVLNDGTIVYWGSGDGIGALPVIAIDVNGKKSPNIMGRDLFWFGLLYNGKLVPAGSSSCKEVQTWHGNCSKFEPVYEHQHVDWRDSTCDSSSSSEYSGAGCADRIMNDGWKMNY